MWIWRRTHWQMVESLSDTDTGSCFELPGDEDTDTMRAVQGGAGKGFVDEGGMVLEEVGRM